MLQGPSLRHFSFQVSIFLSLELFSALSQQLETLTMGSPTGSSMKWTLELAFVAFLLPQMAVAAFQANSTCSLLAALPFSM